MPIVFERVISLRHLDTINDGVGCKVEGEGGLHQPGDFEVVGSIKAVPIPCLIIFEVSVEMVR